MRFRKLRIAWSVLWGLAAVLMVVLWVRSYWWHDGIGVFEIPTFVTSSSRHCDSVAGMLKIEWDDELVTDYALSCASYPIEDTYDAYEDGKVKWGIIVDEGYVSVAVSHWLVVVVFLGAATVPWLRWRFSIRTLLIATTLVAVVLGLIVWAVR